MASDEQTRVITVRERDTSGPHELMPSEIAAIKQAGSRDAGVVWPRDDESDDVPDDDAALDRTALLSMRHDTDGRCFIKAGNIVGFVGLPSARVLHVQSKLGSNIGVFWLLAHALDVARFLKHWPETPAERANPLDWLLLLLRQETRKLVHAGLRKDYVPVEETLGVVRGRILPARTIAETRGLAHRVTCLYDDHTAEVFDNQVLRLALRAGASCAPHLRAELLGTDSLFEGEVSYEPINRAAAADKLRRLIDQHHPTRKAYVAAHSLAYIVLKLLSFSDFGAARKQPGILLNMEKLFEMALRNMLEMDFGSESFTGEFNFVRIGEPPDSSSDRVRKGMKPDIRLRGLLVDAKYKTEPLEKRSGVLEPPDDDIFQAHTYSYFGKRPCALVYAVGNEDEQKDWLACGLNQADASDGPRVGLLGLNIAGVNISALEGSRGKLIDQLRAFRGL